MCRFGDCRSGIAVLLGMIAVGLPAEEPAARPAAGIRVLLEDLHGQSRDRDGGLNFAQGALARVLTQEGARVSSASRVLKSPDRLTAEALQAYDLVVMNGRYTGVAAPFFAPETVRTFDRYVKGGGFLLVIAGGARLGDGRQAGFYNALLAPSGVRFDAAERVPDFAGVIRRRDLEHPLTQRLDRLCPLHGTTLSSRNPQARYLAYLDNKPCLAVAPHGLGWIVALGGGSGWMNQGLETAPPIARDPRIAEPNRQFLRNLAAWVKMHSGGALRLR